MGASKRMVWGARYTPRVSHVPTTNAFASAKKTKCSERGARALPIERVLLDIGVALKGIGFRISG